MAVGPKPVGGFPACLALLLLAATLTGCVSIPDAPKESDVQALSAALNSLGPDVSAHEAGAVARCAHNSSRTQAQQYRVVKPALLHNSLVNLGLRERGLCYQWAEDLLAQLRALELRSIELRWGRARARSWREHNSVVVTAIGQPFEEGIVLDPWRRSGRLVWEQVSADKYPWQEVPPPPAMDPVGGL
jgi:hypothetical protein